MRDDLFIFLFWAISILVSQTSGIPRNLPNAKLLRYTNVVEITLLGLANGKHGSEAES